MNSEKVKEIKKALECCAIHDYSDSCIFSEKHPFACLTEMHKQLLSVINELESENKELNNELKRYKMDWLNSEKMHLQADIEDTEFELFCANKSLGEVRAENKKLKERIAELSAERYIKVEQFAKMLKDRLRYTSPTSDVLELSNLEFDGIEVEQCIDETLKEFIKD